jgi:hypothetical protein
MLRESCACGVVGGSAVVVELGSSTVNEKDFLFKEKIFLKLCDFLDKPPIPASFGFSSSSTIKDKDFLLKKKLCLKLCDFLDKPPIPAKY